MVALYPGTFDPITLGHLDVIADAVKIFDKVIIAVQRNTAKEAMFPISTRLKMVREATEYIGPKVSYSYLEDLATIDVAEKVGAIAIIRSFRMTSDFEYELDMAFTNKLLNPKILTVFIAPHQANIHIRSSKVRELLKFEKYEALQDYVSDEVFNIICLGKDKKK